MLLGQLAERPPGSRASGGTSPMFPATGSIRTAATWPGYASKTSATAPTSLNGQITVSAVAPVVTPGLLGVPRVVAAEPAWTSKASICPW